ncbi:MAG: GTPase domain-containing protein [Acidaminococcaceae bacterium]|nr:GTPase domain-containing protein [Acidaminococcaceae bacterium]MDD4721595.1 GTPase domain-containing protein [Acidaminococcaceae bacterium]
MDVKAQAQDFIEKWVFEDSKKVKIAFFGQPGAGKSSLINELVGKNVTATGNMTDTTKTAQIIEHNEVLFVDLPGYDTSEFPANKYFNSFNPLQYDLFVCVFNEKLQEADKVFFKILQQAKRQCIFVRNKADGIYDNQKSLAELQVEITDDICWQLTDTVKVLFTSCKQTLPIEQRGIAALQEEIIFRLEPALGDKFLRNVRAYSQEILVQKKQETIKAINKAMLIAAGNGLNPIFGVDMGIDAKIMSMMYERIRKSFAISEEEITKGSATDNMLQLIARGVKKETITKGLKKIMTKEMQERLVKYIPIMGQLVSVGLGAGTMYYLGVEYTEACFAYAKKRLETEIKLRVQ